MAIELPIPKFGKNGFIIFIIIWLNTFHKILNIHYFKIKAGHQFPYEVIILLQCTRAENQDYLSAKHSEAGNTINDKKFNI